jgi:Tol biopolymer transport system component
MQRWSNWLVVGAAAAAMVMVQGCASHGPPAPKTQPSAAAVKPAATGAPAVNLFGEFTGMEKPGNGTIGDVGYQQHTFTQEGADSCVAIDPTGQWMCYASTRHSPHSDLYLQRVNGLSVIQLTDDGAETAFPAFSPDGKRIAFSSTRSGNWDLYLMDADGRNTVQLTNGPSQDLHPSFSPDGTKMVYCSMPSRGDQWELWVLDLNTHERKMIGAGLFPNWSPAKNVNRIAFQRARQRGSRWFSLWTLDIVDGEATRQMEVAVSTNAAIISPCWSPDGKHLAFTTVVEKSGNGIQKQSGQQDIWTVDADGANRRRLSDGNASNLTPAWAMDNRIYFISDRGGMPNIWSTKAGPSPTMTAAAE